MPIHFITGKPGGGKGLYCMSWLEKTLTTSEIPILTNLAVEKLPWVNGVGKPQLGLLAYLQKKYKSTFNAENRLVRLTDEQASKFFLYRLLPIAKTSPQQYQLVECPVTMARQSKNGEDDKIIAYDTKLYGETGPHLYVIDEAWKFWGSRNWQNTGEGLIFYNSQHRKPGDDCLICTQHTKQLDTAIWRVAQDFYVCRNRGLLRVGIFRQPDNFRVSVYEFPPALGTTQQAMHTESFKLDREGLAQTYDTTAGVGLAGRMVGDQGGKKSGLPWWSIYIAGALFVVACWFGLSRLAKLAGRAVTPNTNLPSKATTNAPSTSQSLASAFFPMHNTNTVLGRPDGYYAVTNEPVTMTGYCLLPESWRVFLSDGSEYTKNDGHLQFLCPNFCVVDGVTNHIVKVRLSKPGFEPMVATIPAGGGMRDYPEEPSQLIAIGKEKPTQRYQVDKHVQQPRQMGGGTY